MRAIHIQRSFGSGDSISVNEDLYIPELGISFYVIKRILDPTLIMGKIYSEDMSLVYFADLTRTVHRDTPQKPYPILRKREEELDKQDIKCLDYKLREYQLLFAFVSAGREDLTSQLKTASDILLSLIA